MLLQHSLFKINTISKGLDMIETDSQAPDFSLETSDRVVSFSDFQGHKNVMLIFYPLDWTGT